MNAIVARLSTCKESALSADALSALEPVRLKGRIADVYLEFANSEAALQAYLNMEKALQAGSLALRDVETIKLLVSELTQCQYCLSIHSFKSRQAGISEADQLLIRQAKPTGNERTDAIVHLVQALVRQPGTLDQSLFDQARAVNLSDENLVDICMCISTIFFTNITNHINDSKSPLPAAPEIA